MAADALFVGVDGGGSKTLALLADGAGRVVGRGTTGPSNYQVLGAEAAYAALDEAIGAAMANYPRQHPSAICLGMAGAGRPEDQAIFYAWAQSRHPDALVRVVHDAHLVLAAGTPAGWGIALISGTGSLAYGADRAGRTARAGGWGHLLGDEGSGYAIGLAGLRAVVRAADGRGPQTGLTGHLLAHLNLGSPQDLVRCIYGAASPRNTVAGMAPVVQHAAQAGDETARAILGQAGRELALLAKAVADQLCPSRRAPCALAGSILINIREVSATFHQAAQELGLHLKPITPVAEPARGALTLARELAILEAQG